MLTVKGMVSDDKQSRGWQSASVLLGHLYELIAILQNV